MHAAIASQPAESTPKSELTAHAKKTAHKIHTTVHELYQADVGGKKKKHEKLLGELHTAVQGLRECHNSTDPACHKHLKSAYAAATSASKHPKAHRGAEIHGSIKGQSDEYRNHHIHSHPVMEKSGGTKMLLMLKAGTLSELTAKKKKKKKKPKMSKQYC